MDNMPINFYLEHLTKLLCIQTTYFVPGGVMLHRQCYTLLASPSLPETKTSIFGATINFVRHSKNMSRAGKSRKIQIGNMHLARTIFLVDGVKADGIPGTVPTRVEITAKMAGDVSLKFHIQGSKDFTFFG